MLLKYLKTTKEVAKMMGCSVENISKLEKAEKLKPNKIFDNGSFLLNTNEVERFLTQKTAKK